MRKLLFFGVLGYDRCESKGTTVNNINLILLVDIMCNSKAKYGITRNPIVDFETEMAEMGKYFN